MGLRASRPQSEPLISPFPIEDDDQSNSSGAWMEVTAGGARTKRLTTWSEQPLRVWDGPHIVSYNAKKLTTFGFFVRAGTVFDFRHRWIWIQVLILFGFMALGAWYSQNQGDSTNNEWTSELDSASTLLGGLCTFLLSFFVSVVLSRWWSIRDAYGGVQGGVRTITLWAVANCVDSDAGRAVRDRLERYAVLIHALVMKTERCERDLDSLVATGLLLPAEAAQLSDSRQREFVVATWMLMLSSHAADAGLFRQPIATLPILQNAIIALRGSAGATGMYTSTQLPFPYLHLLTALVKMNLITVALQYGQDVGVAYSSAGTQGWIAFIAFRLLLQNFFYQGLLNLHSILSRPWFDHPAHFPRFLWQRTAEEDMREALTLASKLPFALPTPQPTATL